MKKNTSVLKELILSAKERLKNGDYGNATYKQECKRKDKIKTNQVLRFLANAEYKRADIEIKAYSTEEDDKLNKKIEHLLENNPHTIFPLGELVDAEKFKKLNESERQNYILNLSEKFIAYKENYYKKFCSK